VDGGAARRTRLSHGERTRREILDVAEALATREGLEGLTIGRLADAVGMSKGGVFAHFGSKEALQLATIDAATARFHEAVTAPAMGEALGLPRLRAVLERYLAYVEERVPRGGCFFVAASLELDDRPGPLRDRIVDFARARDALIVQALEDAKKRRQLRGKVPVDQLAFELVSLATGAVVELQMRKGPSAPARARAALARWLEALTART
jgi:AcrR family transcriptional regulator